MTERHECEAAVIGAGAVGLAVARALTRAGHETIILERHRHIGGETSSRNSEVIHAGIYYPPGSLKARLCVQGRGLLYAYCESHGVAARRLGKLIVTTGPGESASLAAILLAAQANGARDVHALSQGELRALEPELHAAEGLHSPSTGILDSHQYMLALLGEAEDAGAMLVRDAAVTDIAREGGFYRIAICNDGRDIALYARRVVNAGGLWAQRVARGIEGLDARFIPPLHLAKGNYASLAGPAPFRHLIYPVPEAGGLGIHLTLDMAGRARFGPDVEWIADDPARIDYTVAPSVPARFAERIRAYWPAVRPDMLSPDYAGVRPKLSGPGEPAADFRIDGPEFHGLPGLVNLFGIESPGLTASLAIADMVGAMLKAAP